MLRLLLLFEFATRLLCHQPFETLFANHSIRLDICFSQEERHSRQSNKSQKQLKMKKGQPFKVNRIIWLSRKDRCGGRDLLNRNALGMLGLTYSTKTNGSFRRDYFNYSDLITTREIRIRTRSVELRNSVYQVRCSKSGHNLRSIPNRSQ